MKKHASSAVVVLFLACAWLFGAIAYDNSASVAQSTNPQDLSLANAATSDRVTLFFMQGDSGDVLSAVPTYNSVNSTAIAAAFTDTTAFNMREERHYLVASASGTNNCHWVWTAVAGKDVVACITLNGVDQSTPLRTSSRQTVNDAMGAATASVNCTTVSGDIVVSVFAFYTASTFPTLTPGGGMTIQTSAAASTGIKIHVATQTASGTTTTSSYTWTGNRDFTFACYPVVPVASATRQQGGTMLGVQ